MGVMIAGERYKGQRTYDIAATRGGETDQGIVCL